MIKRSLIIIIFLLLVLASGAFAENCKKATLLEGIGKGAILTTTSGHIYKVNVLNLDEVRSWQPKAHLLICSHTALINNIKYDALNIINLGQLSEISVKQLQ